jgi:DNA invertase Pin-like site-specific DNA recombinase
MMMNMVACFAQFEREVIVQRIKRGPEHARANDDAAPDGKSS